MNKKKPYKRYRTRPDGSSKPVRIAIYIFPNQLAMLEKISEKTGKRKRHLFFEMIAQYIADWRGKV